MASKSEHVFDVNQQEFETKVLLKSKQTPVVVDFWAPWCGPCRSLAPILEKLVTARNGDILLAKVNTDEDQKLAMDYGIDVLPTVIAFRDGKPILDFVGVLSEAELNSFLDRLLPSEAEKQASAAAKLETSDPAQAEKMYREALGRDTKQESAILGLARILVASDRDAEAAELIEPIGADGDHGAEAERLGAVMWLKQKANACPDAASLRGRLEAEPKNATLRYELGLRLAAAGDHQAALDMLLAAGELDYKLAGSEVREAMVKIFQLVGVRSTLADTYRGKLSSLLY